MKREQDRRPGDPTDFFWFSPQPPPELVRLLDSMVIPSGAALDVGCGVGMSTSYLAGRFHPSVGCDLRFSVLRHALERTASGPRIFVVNVRVPWLPFRSASFAFVFDRGCMHNIPRRHYAAYLRAVATVLRPNGVFELFFVKRLKRRTPIWTIRGMANLLRQILRRVRPRVLTRRMLRALLPPELQVVSYGTAPFISPKTGEHITFTHAVFRRVA